MCRLYAGQGTKHKGQGPCRLHGGNLPSVDAKAVALRTQRDMVKLGAPVAHLKPMAALLTLLRVSAGHVDYLHKAIGGLEDLSSAESTAILRLYNEERERLASVAGVCLRSGMASRQVEIRLALTDVIAGAVRTACERAGFSEEMTFTLGLELKAITAELAEQYPGPQDEDLWGGVLDEVA